MLNRLTHACFASALAILAAILPTPAKAQRSTPLQLVQSGGSQGDNFGNAVAVDGDTMIVAANHDDVGANTNQGSVSVYRWTGSGWALEAMLTASDGAALDDFGTVVALSGDTVVVGAPGDDIGASSLQGSAYVFVRSGTTWSQQAQLIAPDGRQADRFGTAVSISGDTVVVGAPSGDEGTNFNQGVAYVFTRSGTTWTSQARLIAADGAADDGFGIALAISGDTVIVGASADTVGSSTDQGSAYIFTRSATTWAQQAQLIASDGAAGDVFGDSVAISGDTAVVGAWSYQQDFDFEQGAAYIFVRSGTVWTQQFMAIGDRRSDFFGRSVAISGDTVVVGANQDDVGGNANQGSASVFVRSGTTWIRQTQLLAPDGSAIDNFGVSVAIFGDTALVGAHFDDVGANDSQGSAWTFSRTGERWIGPDLELLASDGLPADNFGFCVSVSGDTAIIGSPLDDVGVNTDQGSAYIFARSGSAWIQQAQITGGDGAANDNFGFSVAISGDTAVVGAYNDDRGTRVDQGSAYVFVRSGTTWLQQSRLNHPDGATDDQFGYSVAISGDTVVVGANADDVVTNSNQGSGYVFVRSGTAWGMQAQLNAADGAADDNFGVRVAISGDTVIVGANRDDVGANANQGSAYVFVRTGTTWSQQAQFTAADGDANDSFGGSVAISGDTAVVGSSLDDIGANADQGSAAVFVRSGTAWAQQALLTDGQGAPGDSFGSSVAIDGDTVIVGASLDDVGANLNQGSASVFVRAGTSWVPCERLTGTDRAPADLFGICVAISEETAVVGAYADDVGANINQGSAYTFDVLSDDLSLAVNDTIDAAYPTLTAALLAAQSGQQITATEGAWRTTSDLDTGNRSLVLRSSGDLRTPSETTLTLGGQSSLTAAVGSVMEIFGSLGTSTQAAASLSADAFTLGSRGNLSITASSSLGINSPTATLVGRTLIEPRASLAISGTLTVNGQIAAGNDSTLVTGGSFDCTINTNTRYDMSLATLELEGTSTEQTLEVMSRDIGADVLGLDRTIVGHYPIGTLHFGPSPSVVRLVDTHDNDGLGQGSCEAIYVNTLQIDAGSRLINPSCKLYYNLLINNGTIDDLSNVIRLSAPVCPADFNNDGGVDSDDVIGFFSAWDSGEAAADFNRDDSTDGDDVIAFFTRWDAGC